MFSDSVITNFLLVLTVIFLKVGQHLTKLQRTKMVPIFFFFGGGTLYWSKRTKCARPSFAAAASVI